MCSLPSAHRGPGPDRNYGTSEYSFCIVSTYLISSQLAAEVNLHPVPSDDLEASERKKALAACYLVRVDAVGRVLIGQYRADINIVLG
jgi:hypothetical protein